ncbi:MAG: hypothetical protein WKF41_15380 [Gaiellaceae bacterium]
MKDDPLTSNLPATGFESGYPIPKIPTYALPPFVKSDEDRERWELVVAVAEELSRQNEPSGVPDSQFVWQYSRTLFHSDVPTGSADEPLVIPDCG